jgi:broad specificity phosphatase PhoE
MNNTYFILRHGETPYQVKKEITIYPWPEPSPIFLTKRGEGQIEKAAEELMDKNIDLIFSSDITRTKQTSEIVSRKINVQPIFDIRLREINYGDYKGKLIKDYRKEFSTLKQKFFEKPKNGESGLDVEKRLLDFFNEIDKKYTNKTILIISHQGVLHILEGLLIGVKDENLLDKNEASSLMTGEFKKIKHKQ